ncbi:hypothetical protein C1N74_16335 (plasmid) [Microbacterium sp. SGAir0570]|nr:hypothetical protein C1N74_16335 [Microbacterium sp. SGAir0570]
MTGAPPLLTVSAIARDTRPDLSYSCLLCAFQAVLPVLVSSHVSVRRPWSSTAKFSRPVPELSG